MRQEQSYRLHSERGGSVQQMPMDGDGQARPMDMSDLERRRGNAEQARPEDSLDFHALFEEAPALFLAPCARLHNPCRFKGLPGSHNDR